MSFFSDLSAYTYKQSGTHDGTVNIGWLDVSEPYTQGSVPSEFVERLWWFCRSRVVQTRGCHICNLCPRRRVGPLKVTRGEDVLTLGSAEIRVFGFSKRIYAAPNLLFHYVTEHNYRPPDEFIDAVLHGPVPGSEEYQSLLVQLDLR